METLDYGIYVDGIYYHVPVLSCKRTSDFLWKYAERDETGVHMGELLGVYFNYSLSIGQIVDREEYNRFFDKITEKTEYHVVAMPGTGGSMFTFQAYFSGVKDEVKRSKNGKNIFCGLQFEMTTKEPTR